jgi:uncharacterized protein YutE (UPF0331/DUF86 family)
VSEKLPEIRTLDPNEPIKYKDEINGFRNILVHGYDLVDDGVVNS